MKNIVFIAKYPTGELTKDGASIRFLAIDKIFKNYKKIYIESFLFPLHLFFYFLFREIKRKLYKYPLFQDANTTSYKYLSFFKTKKIFNNADIIYIENFTNLVRLDKNLIKNYGNKMVLDFHGCVIEEMEASKTPMIILNNMKNYEKLALENIKTFVSVTKNMTEYFQNKYPVSKNSKYIELPIFNENCPQNIKKNSNETSLVIYSGKNQVWQNCELMISSIAKFVQENSDRNVKFKILTPDIAEINRLLESYDIINQVEVVSVSAEQLQYEYSEADFGFILRDDCIINNVACPTKLIEYMQYGVIPIVLQPNIGDFMKLGYRYILNDDFINGRLPSKSEQENMRKVNYEVVQKLIQQVEEAKQELLNL